MMLNGPSKKEIYGYCELQWDKYESEDGGYFPSKHDKLVFQNAAIHFNMHVDDVYAAWETVSVVKARQPVGSMTREQIFSSLNGIVKGNAESPWSEKE